MSGKLPLVNPFATSKDVIASTSIQSAFISKTSASGGVLPPGLGFHSHEKRVDPWKEHSFQRRVRNLHSLEAFGDAGEADEIEDDEGGDAWTKSYITQPHVGRPQRFTDASEKRPNPTNCENCDRDFFTEDALRAHVAEHETCGVEGCPYTAHPKLLLNHYKTQHLTGLAGKVWKIQTPEDIAKWRDERKRNFPTVARVAQRKREARERKKRGNVLNNQYFGKITGDARASRNDFRGHGRGMSRGCRGRGARGGSGMRGGTSFRPIDNEFDADSDPSSSDEENYAFSTIGVAQLQEPDEEEEKQSSPAMSASPAAAATSAVGVLGNLASAYASSDEDREDDDDKLYSNSNDHPASRSTADDSSIDIKKKSRKRRMRKNGDGEKPEAAMRLLTDGQVKYQLTKKRRKRAPTLLERLLAPEIRRERNFILQCVRYIVKNNFFYE